MTTTSTPTKRKSKAQRQAEAELAYPQQELPVDPGQRTLFPPDLELAPAPEPEPTDAPNNKDVEPEGHWCPKTAHDIDESWPAWCYVRDLVRAAKASEGLDRLGRHDRRVLMVVAQMVAEGVPTGWQRVGIRVAQLEAQAPLGWGKSVRRSLRILIEAGWLTPRPHGGPIPSDKLREAFRAARAAQGGAK